MSGRSRWTTLVLVSAAIAGALSVLPALVAREPAEAVFRPVKSQIMNERNLVDFLAQLPLRRAEWDVTMLQVDLELGNGTVGTPTVFADMAQVIDRAFGTTLNVRQVLVRVLEPGGSANGRLLVAVYAKRDEWAKAAVALPDRPIDREAWMNEAFQVTYTREWRFRFPDAPDRT